MGVILRASAFPLTGTHNSPLLSHQLNLNKSSPSWPHPPASAFLPRGPEAPTTQVVWEGGGDATLLPEGGLHTVNTCTQPRCCLRSLSHTLFSSVHMCSYSDVCPTLRQARTMCMPTQDTRAHSSPSAKHMCPLYRMSGCFATCPSEMQSSMTVTCTSVTCICAQHCIWS